MKRIPFIIMLLYSCNVFAQNKSDTLHWKTDYKLRWDDFKGLPDTNVTGKAATVSGLITKSIYTSDTTIKVRVRAVFYKGSSWVKSSWNNPYALNHEQGHFDITEVFARKANIAFEKYKLNKATVADDINRIFDSIIADKDKMQDLYDKETTRPINIKMQKKWDSIISSLLKKYKDGKECRAVNNAATVAGFRLLYASKPLLNHSS